MKTPPPTILAPADDPAAAVKTPPPTILAPADDPAAAVKTPPPTLVAADVPVESPAGVADQPSRRTLERPEAIISDFEERPERFVLETRSRRPRVIALVGVLLLGGAGIAVWAARSRLVQSTTAPVVASPTAPAPTPAPSPPPLAADPVVVPAAPAAPVAPDPTPARLPPPPATAPVAAPAAPAAEEAAAPAALPRQKPAAPAKMAKATAHAPGKLASSRTGRPRPSSARRKAPAAAAETAIKTAPAAESAPSLPPAAKAEPQPESEPPTPSTATAAPESTTAASATVDDLVREAQLAWMRGHHTAAISKAQSVLKAKPKPAQVVQAYEIIATCSCALGQADAAREAASHLSDTRRELVKAVCKRNGVTIE